MSFIVLYVRFTVFTRHASVVRSVLLLPLIDYRTDIIILDCDHSLGYRDRHLCYKL